MGMCSFPAPWKKRKPSQIWHSLNHTETQRRKNWYSRSSVLASITSFLSSVLHLIPYESILHADALGILYVSLTTSMSCLKPPLPLWSRTMGTLQGVSADWQEVVHEKKVVCLNHIAMLTRLTWSPRSLPREPSGLPGHQSTCLAFTPPLLWPIGSCYLSLQISPTCPILILSLKPPEKIETIKKEALWHPLTHFNLCSNTSLLSEPTPR